MLDRTILVPLDGSELSESAVPHAMALANATRARLHFITVWEDSERELIARIPEKSDDLLRQAGDYHKRYLAVLARSAGARGVDVATDVLIGDPADEILHAVERCLPRMVVMATHGRSGLGRWRYGSVASRIARETPVPAMMIGPRALESGASASLIRRILVPVDGSSLAESALLPARELAETLEADLLLAKVVRWATQTATFGVPEIDAVQVDRDLEDAAHYYLRRVRKRLGTKRRVETRVLHGTAADMLIELVAAERIDLVVMASHTRGGLARAVLGSVADRLIQGEAPVLLVRPGTGEAAIRPHLQAVSARESGSQRRTFRSGNKVVSAVRPSHGYGKRGRR